MTKRQFRLVNLAYWILLLPSCLSVTAIWTIPLQRLIGLDWPVHLVNDTQEPLRITVLNQDDRPLPTPHFLMSPRAGRLRIDPAQSMTLYYNPDTSSPRSVIVERENGERYRVAFERRDPLLLFQDRNALHTHHIRTLADAEPLPSDFPAMPNLRLGSFFIAWVLTLSPISLLLLYVARKDHPFEAARTPAAIGMDTHVDTLRH